LRRLNTFITFFVIERNVFITFSKTESIYNFVKINIVQIMTYILYTHLKEFANHILKTESIYNFVKINIVLIMALFIIY